MAQTTTKRTRLAEQTPATKLDERVFSVIPTDHTLLKEAYVAYLANGRDNLAITKTRAGVSGGGKKPWKQKGTGRARVGSSRVPHWRGGGVSFGPTGNENYSKHLNVKAKRLALCQALSLAAQAGNIKVIDMFEYKEGKVARTLAQLKKADAEGKVLLALTQKDQLAERATRNLSTVKLVRADHLNVFDVMNADTIVFDTAALEVVTAWLGVDRTNRKETK